MQNFCWLEKPQIGEKFQANYIMGAILAAVTHIWWWYVEKYDLQEPVLYWNLANNINNVTETVGVELPIWYSVLPADIYNEYVFWIW